MRTARSPRVSFVARWSPLAALVLVPVLALAAADAGPDAATTRLLAALDLQESATPVREHPGWRPPGRILVAVDTPERLAWLEAVAGDAELVPISSVAEAETSLAGARALLGICSPELITAGRDLHWVQSYSAGVDVTDPEPLPEGHPLWSMPRVIITPHISARTRASGERRWLLVRENLRRYVAGEPMLSEVDLGRGY